MTMDNPKVIEAAQRWDAELKMQRKLEGDFYVAQGRFSGMPSPELLGELVRIGALLIGQAKQTEFAFAAIEAARRLP